MNRHDLPISSAAPDLPGQITEIRLPERSEKHEARRQQEVRA